MWRRFRSKPRRVQMAIVSICVVAVGWPTSAVLQAAGFPIFEQVMLALSWLAPAYTAVDMLFTAQVHEQQAKDSEKGPGGAQ